MTNKEKYNKKIELAKKTLIDKLFAELNSFQFAAWRLLDMRVDNLGIGIVDYSDANYDLEESFLDQKNFNYCCIDIEDMIKLFTGETIKDWEKVKTVNGSLDLDIFAIKIPVKNKYKKEFKEIIEQKNELIEFEKITRKNNDGIMETIVFYTN